MEQAAVTVNSLPISRKKTKRIPATNIFICLVHEREESVLDLVRNLLFLDGDSKIILYNGGTNKQLLDEREAYEELGVFIHPNPTPQKYGYLHGFALDCMSYALEHFDFETITNVDSDQIGLRSGYSEYITAFLANKSNVGLLSSDAKRFTPANSPNKFVVNQAFKEFNLWKPLLATFPNGNEQFAHWTFWPSTIFTRQAVEDMLTLFRENELLKSIMTKTKIWATEEIIFPTLIKLLGYDIVTNPCSFDYVKYRVDFNKKDLHKALNNPSCFWMHPVNRSYGNAIRRSIREHFDYYSKQLEAGKASDKTFFDIDDLLKTSASIEGWLSQKEALLLISTTLNACMQFPESSNIVEVGCYHGKFSVILGKVAKAILPETSIVCIDPHDGKLGERNNAEIVPPSYDFFLNNISVARLEAVIESIKDSVQNITWNKPISLLVIDGLHDYESTKADFEHFSNWVMDGGYVVFHDYAEYFPGVMRFVDELIAGGQFVKQSLAQSLIVLRRSPLYDEYN